jgi:hypothetical protein
VENLPVNGRNFANLMTLAPGATSDGNGGWASVRFNGKSNQQNYLNYDGVDGTYVWDASPGYLNSTGSQFRLQTSMESVAEFRVNSGLAPAESGLGAGRQHHGGQQERQQQPSRFALRLLPQRRARLGQQVRRQEARAQPQPVRRLDRRPHRPQQTFLFGSFEGLRQTTGLSFTEAVAERAARARVLAGAAHRQRRRQSPERTQAVAPLLAGFPLGTVATANPLLSLASLQTEAKQEENSVSVRLDHALNNTTTPSTSDICTARRGRHAGPHRHAAPRAGQAAAAERRGQLSVALQFQHGERVQGRAQPAGDQRDRFWHTGLRPDGVSLSGTVTSSRLTRAAPPGSRAAAC